MPTFKVLVEVNYMAVEEIEVDAKNIGELERKFDELIYSVDIPEVAGITETRRHVFSATNAKDGTEWLF